MSPQPSRTLRLRRFGFESPCLPPCPGSGLRWDHRNRTSAGSCRLLSSSAWDGPLIWPVPQFPHLQVGSVLVLSKGGCAWHTLSFNTDSSTLTGRRLWCVGRHGPDSWGLPSFLHWPFPVPVAHLGHSLTLSHLPTPLRTLPLRSQPKITFSGKSSWPSCPGRPLVRTLTTLGAFPPKYACMMCSFAWQLMKVPLSMSRRPLEVGDQRLETVATLFTIVSDCAASRSYRSGFVNLWLPLAPL